MSALADERVETLIAGVKEAVTNGEETTGLLEEYSLAQRARAMTELFNRGEHEYLPMLLFPDHVHDMRPVRIPGMGVYRGREAYAGFIEDWVESFPGAQLQTEFELEVSEPVNAVFAIIKQEMRGGASEVPIAFRYGVSAEYSDERHESVFGTDIEEMRQRFRERYGQDPGPFELEPISHAAKQEE